MISRGRNINVTLIFSLQRHQEVAEAYIRGLERLVEAGGDPSTVASVASFFVSRVDTEADRRLDEVGHPELKGKLAIANAKLAYQNYKETFSGERWEALAAKGASTQRCLWASTSTKNPDYRDVMYVEELIGPETVDTMPKETVDAFQDHGEVAPTLEADLDEAQQLLEQLADGRRRLRRRLRDARARRRPEVLRLVHGAARGHRGQARAASAGVTETAQAELHYEVAGEGPPVVLVHEGIADSRMWEPQWTSFPPVHRTVRYDMRGFGRTPISPGSFFERGATWSGCWSGWLSARLRSSASRWAAGSHSRSP